MPLGVRAGHGSPADGDGPRRCRLRSSRGHDAAAGWSCRRRSGRAARSRRVSKVEVDVGRGRWCRRSFLVTPSEAATVVHGTGPLGRTSPQRRAGTTSDWRSATGERRGRLAAGSAVDRPRCVGRPRSAKTTPRTQTHRDHGRAGARAAEAWSSSTSRTEASASAGSSQARRPTMSISGQHQPHHQRRAAPVAEDCDQVRSRATRSLLYGVGVDQLADRVGCES